MITKGKYLTTPPKGGVNIIGALQEAHTLLGICLTNLGVGVVGAVTPKVTNIATGHPINPLVSTRQPMSAASRRKLSLASKRRWAQRKGVAA